MKVHNAMLFLFGAIIIVGAQFFGGVPGLVGAAFGFVWAFFLAYATKIRYVPTILVLCLPALGVRALGDFFFLPELGLTPVTLTFLGADWPTSLAVMVGAFLRIALRALQPRSLIWEIVPGILLFGFFGTLLLSLLSAYQGYELGLNRFSQGTRAILALGGVFWGILLVERSGHSTAPLMAKIRKMALAGSGLLLLGGLKGHLYFLVYGLSGGLIVDSARRKARVVTLLFVGVSVLAFVHGTLTTAAISLLAMVFTLIATIKIGRTSALWRRAIAIVGAGSVLVFTAIVVWVGVGGAGMDVVLDREVSVHDFLLYKMFFDRAPLWVAGFEQIIEGPFVLVPSGRVLFPEGFVTVGIEGWDFGAHNAILELLRHNGVLGGGWGVAVIAYVIVSVGKVLSKSRDSQLQGLSAGVLAIGIAGVTAGNFPVRDVGFFIWALAGSILGAAHQQASRPVPPGKLIKESLTFYDGRPDRPPAPGVMG